MSDKPMPADMSAKWSSLPHLDYKGRSRGVDEWHSACPVCGDGDHVHGTGPPNRFFIQAQKGDINPHGKCRRCGHLEWLDSDRNERPTPEQILEATALRRRYAQQEARRLRTKIDTLREMAVWNLFNEQMTERQRLYWRNAGIPDNFQNFWKLGHNPKLSFSNGSQYTTGPALSIPYFAPSDNGRQAFNIQYRLLKPPKPNDKYRFTTGLRPGLWLSQPDEAITGACVLCEGMKKAAVAFIHLVAQLENKWTVIAAPNKIPGAEMIAKLGDCDPVFILFDPDAYEPTRKMDGTRSEPAVNRLLKMMVGRDVRLIKLPAKLDDLLLLDKGFARDVERAIHRARRVS